MAERFRHKFVYEYLLWIVLSAISFVIAAAHIMQDEYPFSRFRIWIVLAAAAGEAVFVLVLWKSRRNMAAVFLSSYLIFGSFYFMAVPLFRVPDELTHFLRAYEISEGHMLSDMNADGLGGRELSYNLNPENIGLDQTNTTQFDIWERYGKERLSDENAFLVFWNTSLYAPVSYLPQSLGIGFMRLITDRIVWIAYAGRITTFLAAGLIGFLAVKYIPFGKKAMLLLLLLPMNMQESVSLAPDSMVTALTCALISFVLYMRYVRTERMQRSHYAMLYILCILIGLYKIVYLPFCLFPFLIPEERFGGKRAYLFHALVLGSLVAVISLGWLMTAGSYLSDIWGADSDAQVQFILSDPVRYLGILWNTIRLEGTKYLYNIVGMDYGWLTIHISKGIVIAYAVLCLAAMFLPGEEAPESFRPMRLTALTVTVFVCLLIFTSIYVQWNVPQAETVLGIQGRYFIPLVFPVYLLFHGLIRPIRKEVSLSVPCMLLVFGLQLCILSDIFSVCIGEYGGGWQEDAGGSRYWISEKEYVRDKWYQSEGQWYYFDESGYPLKDTWVEGEQGDYYLSESGAMLTDTVTPDGYLVDEKGRRMGKWIK